MSLCRLHGGGDVKRTWKKKGEEKLVGQILLFRKLAPPLPLDFGKKKMQKLECRFHLLLSQAHVLTHELVRSNLRHLTNWPLNLQKLQKFMRAPYLTNHGFYFR